MKKQYALLFEEWVQSDSWNPDGIKGDWVLRCLMCESFAGALLERDQMMRKHSQYRNIQFFKKL